MKLYRKKLDPSEAYKYLEGIITESKILYENKPFRSTEPEPHVAQKLAIEKGNFILCIIPPTYLNDLIPGNKLRREEVLDYVKNEEFLNVKPIMIEDYVGKKLITIDGKARAWSSNHLNRSILGYIPEKVISKLPQVRRLDDF